MFNEIFAAFIKQFAFIGTGNIISCMQHIVTAIETQMKVGDPKNAAIDAITMFLQTYKDIVPASTETTLEQQNTSTETPISLQTESTG